MNPNPDKPAARAAQTWALRLVLLVILGLIALLMLGAPWRHRAAPFVPGSRPQVTGSPVFVAQVNAALDALARRCPDAFETVRRYVGVVRQGEHSGMWAWENPPALELHDRSAMHSVTWCAGTIVHDAHHSRLYHEYIARHGRDVPESAWTGTAVEKECIAVQLAVLRCLDAPASEIAHLEAQDGTHWDTNKDGRSDFRDYAERDW